MKPIGRPVVLALCALGVIAAASLDFMTSGRILMAPLYAVPAGCAAWAAGRRAGLAFAVLGTAAGRAAAVLGGAGTPGPIATVWDTGAQLALLVAVALLAAALRDRTDGSRSLERRDPLTGLANLEAFRERAALEVERSRRWNRPLTLACLELDDIEALAAEFGREAAAEALRTVAVSLRSAFRSTDLPARIGSARFVLLLPETDRRGARVVLEKAVSLVRRDLARGGWPVEACACSVTSSGFVEVAALLRRAGALMEEVKADAHRAVRDADV